MRLQRKQKINASFITYILNIFDGKLTYNDITTMPLSRLIQMQKIKEDELDARAKNIKELQKNQEETQMTINNNGNRFKDKSNKNL